MIDPKNVNLNQLPKKFADGAVGGFGRDIFVIAIASGNELTPFAVTPQIAKSIASWLTENVANYEKRYGLIDMSQPMIESPIQFDDLSGSSDKGPEKK